MKINKILEKRSIIQGATNAEISIPKNTESMPINTNEKKEAKIQTILLYLILAIVAIKNDLSPKPAMKNVTVKLNNVPDSIVLNSSLLFEILSSLFESLKEFNFKLLVLKLFS